MIYIKQLEKFDDERGWLTEIFRIGLTEYPIMGYISCTNPGVVRGPHEHKEQSDAFYFMGEFELYLWDNRPIFLSYKEKLVIKTELDKLYCVPPGVVHAYKNIGNSIGYVFNGPDRLYRGYDKKQPADEIRHELDENSDFQIIS